MQPGIKFRSLFGNLKLISKLYSINDADMKEKQSIVCFWQMILKKNQENAFSEIKMIKSMRVVLYWSPY